MSKHSILPQIRDNFKLDSLINGKQNIGKLSPEDAKEQNATLFTFNYGSCESGLALNIYWLLSSEERIVDCKVESFGESELIAAASIAALISKNKTADEILQLKEKGLEYFLRENPNNEALPKSLRFITNVTIDALYQAAKSYKKEPIEESIVDPSTGVSERFIKESIKRFDITSTDELRDYTRAGAFGETLHNPNYPSQFDELLKSVRKEIENAAAATKTISDKPFKEMNVDEKRTAIEAVIDENIRQMLIMDGGDMEILDIKENGEDTDIYIRYLGACNGCASASTGTLFAIEGILKQKLDSSIRVIPL
jgi:NifU-like protein